jgi:hypothetical protein
VDAAKKPAAGPIQALLDHPVELKTVICVAIDVTGHHVLSIVAGGSLTELRGLAEESRDLVEQFIDQTRARQAQANAPRIAVPNLAGRIQ